MSDPFDNLDWYNFGQSWRNLSFALRGFPMFMPGYCDECGLRDCHDPGCQRTREAIFTDVNELACNCVAIRGAIGPAPRRDLVGGHEPDCVCTNDMLAIEKTEAWTPEMDAPWTDFQLPISVHYKTYLDEDGYWWVVVDVAAVDVVDGGIANFKTRYRGARPDTERGERDVIASTIRDALTHEVREQLGLEPHKIRKEEP